MQQVIFKQASSLVNPSNISDINETDFIDFCKKSTKQHSAMSNPGKIFFAFLIYFIGIFKNKTIKKKV